MHTLEQLRAGKLCGARHLKLSENLTEFPTEILSLKETLEVLDLTGNQLSTLPEGFGRLSSLVKLQASFNPFTHLPASLFDGLKELEMFRLAVGKLQQWPPGLAEAGGHNCSAESAAKTFV